MKTPIISIILLLVGCNHTYNQDDCRAIARDIKMTAENNVPPLDYVGICRSTNPDIQKHFVPKCYELHVCNSYLEERFRFVDPFYKR